LARKILLADDSVTAQNMGRRILTDAGYEVTTVNNGSAALKKIAELKPDIVVLDVYMPGYGGLEVCQRIKENKETTRIPVLLSVGKLEPFKPDEARRVRADAYIVKPFEASELLTALTKLEDKIVPQPEPIKPGRLAKAIAAVEEAPANSFGDAESGWKERLNIPHPAVKGTDPEPVPAASTKATDGSVEEPESKTSAALPTDITSEEIAAIRAAAAAMKAAAENVAAADPVQVESSEALTPVSASEPAVEIPSFAIEPEPVEEESPATFASAAQADTVSEAISDIRTDASAEAASVELPQPVEETKPEPVAAVSEVAETSSIDTDRALNPDAEVMAALASLGSSSDTPFEPDFKSALDVVVAASTITGPRWIAEPVPLSLEEASFVLEQEMEKQYAAFAAADAVCAKLTAGAISASSFDSSSVVVAEAPPVLSEAPQGPAAGPDATTTEESGEAFAAAAGASVSAVAVTSTEAADTDTKDPGEAQRDSELAAAWTNWKQIRESILGSQTAVHLSAVAEPSTLVADSNQPQASTESAEPASVESAKSPEEPNTSDAISSIVDNMLAELKPKLMEEIAKKLKSEKS
jgi:twitching motility two-component system response regulator PilH